MSVQEPIVDSTPTGSEIPAAPITAPAPVATQPVTPVAATPATPEPNRSDWVPPHRLRETREAAQREFATKETQYQAELEQVKRQLQALVGVQPPQNPEIDLVRSQFSQLYPGLSKMEERAADLEKMMERTQQLEAQSTHYWDAHSRTVTNQLFSVAEKSLGSPLTEEGKQQLHSYFVGYIQSNPGMEERYVKDPALVGDFWKAFQSSFIDPARRAATTSAVGRVPTGLPQDTPSGTPQAAPVPKLTSLDARADAAWAQLQAHRSNS